MGRKISFAVSAERSSSLHSSTTSLSAVDPSASFSEDKKEIRGDVFISERGFC